jgi:L,D-peptidoglycan transpeptidase YkuD (ErfK/YbiS/YcfS/YnhG family)
MTRTTDGCTLNVTAYMTPQVRRIQSGRRKTAAPNRQTFLLLIQTGLNKTGKVSSNVTLRRVRCNHCWSGKAISITYSEFVSVALGTQHAMRMRHIVILRLPGSTVFFHILMNGRIFKKKGY